MKEKRIVEWLKKNNYNPSDDWNNDESFVSELENCGYKKTAIDSAFNVISSDKEKIKDVQALVDNLLKILEYKSQIAN
jgi:Holliday junction resolvasome RuvABC DNA-binding subunit